MINIINELTISLLDKAVEYTLYRDRVPDQTNITILAEFIHTDNITQRFFKNVIELVLVDCMNEVRNTVDSNSADTIEQKFKQHFGI